MTTVQYALLALAGAALIIPVAAFGPAEIVVGGFYALVIGGDEVTP